MEPTKEDAFRLMDRIEKENINIATDPRFVRSIDMNTFQPIITFEGIAYKMEVMQDSKCTDEYKEWKEKLNA